MRPFLPLAGLLVACQQPPEISDLAVATEGFVAGVAFVANDPNEDLDDGAVVLNFAGNEVRYPLVSENSDVEREGTVISLTYIYPACLAGTSGTVSVTVEDALGNRSNALVVMAELDGQAMEEDEVNDTSTDANYQPWPDDGPIGFCGWIHQVGLDSHSQYVEDDWFEFRPRYYDDVVVTLQAPIGSEFDLWLFDDYGDKEVARFEDAVVGAGFQYLTATLPFEDGGNVYVSVGAGGGIEGPYSVYAEQPNH